MKKLVLVITVMLVKQISAQSVLDSLSFEQPIHDLIIDPDTNNQWQIGKPTKSVFTNAISGNAAIVTDTLQPYVAGTKSMFVLDMIKYMTGDTIDWNEHHVSFTHSMNADSLHAGGYIEISQDSINWYNIYDSQHLSDSLGIWNMFYSEEGTDLYNGQRGFTGNFTNQPYYFHYYYYIGKSAWPFSRPYFRFVFESDSLASTGDGWMLDGFGLFIASGGSVNESLSRSIKTYPNPAIDRLAFDIDEKQFKPTAYRITNIVGQQLSQGAFTSKPLDVSNLIPGAYIITLTDAKGNAAAKVFYKQ